MLKGKRGSSLVAMETDALSIKHAIDRAASKALRKDTYEEVSASLRQALGVACQVMSLQSSKTVNQPYFDLLKIELICLTA